MSSHKPHLYRDTVHLVRIMKNRFTNNVDRLKILKDLQETNEQILAHEFNLAYQRSIASIYAHTVLLTIYWAGTKKTSSMPITTLAEWIPCSGVAVAIFSISGFWAAHRVVGVLEYQRSVLLNAVNHFLFQSPTDQSPTDQSPTDQSPTDQSPTDQSPTAKSTGTDVTLTLNPPHWQLIDLGSHRFHPDPGKTSKLWISKHFGFWSPVGILIVFLVIWSALLVLGFNWNWLIPKITTLLLLLCAAFVNYKWWFFSTQFLPKEQRQDGGDSEQSFGKSLKEWLAYLKKKLR
jgi:hypothetical protein